MRWRMLWTAAVLGAISTIASAAETIRIVDDVALFKIN